MTDGPIKVNFAELSNAGSSIGSQAQQVQQLLDDLKSRVIPVVGQWEGVAGEGYQESQRKWDTAAADLQQVLASIATAVNQATEAYQGAEASNAKRWG